MDAIRVGVVPFTIALLACTDSERHGNPEPDAAVSVGASAGTGGSGGSGGSDPSGTGGSSTAAGSGGVNATGGSIGEGGLSSVDLRV